MVRGERRCGLKRRDWLIAIREEREIGFSEGAQGSNAGYFILGCSRAAVNPKIATLNLRVAVFELTTILLPLKGCDFGLTKSLHS